MSAHSTTIFIVPINRSKQLYARSVHSDYFWNREAAFLQSREKAFHACVVKAALCAAHAGQNRIQRSLRRSGRIQLSIRAATFYRLLQRLPQLYAPHLSFFSRSSHFQLYSVFVNNPNYHSLVFTNELSKSLNRRTVYKHLKKILSSIVLDDCYFHTLRHTFATLSLQNGDDVLTVKENLGDHSAAFTLNTYGYLIQAMRRDSAERMEKAVPNDCDRQKCVIVVRKNVPRKNVPCFCTKQQKPNFIFR